MRHMDAAEVADRLEKMDVFDNEGLVELAIVLARRVARLEAAQEMRLT